MTRRPNVILITCDDLGYGDLSCYGSTQHDTPALDRMADEGVRFTDFYMASPVCSPTRSDQRAAVSGLPCTKTVVMEMGSLLLMGAGSGAGIAQPRSGRSYSAM